MAGWENWTKEAKVITVIAGAIGAIATATVAVPPAWTQLGLPRVAFESYVNEKLIKVEQAQAQLRTDTNAVRLDINAMRRGQIDGEKLRLEGDLQKADNEGYRSLIRQRMRQLEAEAASLDVQNESLQKR